MKSKFLKKAAPWGRLLSISLNDHSKINIMKTKRNGFWTTAFTALFLAAFVGGCKDDKMGIDGLCPLVVSTNPVNGAVGVPLDQIVSVTFNEPMNPATITPSAFTLLSPGSPGGRMDGVSKSSATKISGTLTYNAANYTMTFTPGTKLAPNAVYTGTVATLVKDLKGNALQVDYVWTFSTSLSPSVTSTDPANNATAVVLNKIVRATFNAPMDPVTITATTFTLKQGATSVAGTVSYTGTTASFKPTSNLLSSTTYTATITTGAKNAAGIPLAADFVWTFITGATTAPTVNSTDPPDNATGVLLNKIVTATFSTAMDPLTITATTFTMTQGATSVAGTVSYSGSTASFTPTGGLLSGTTYTATITTGAKNVAGNPLANNYVWTFATGTITAPTVNSTDPLNNATGVVLNKIVTATFSTPMDPLTITTSTFLINQGATSVAGTVSYSGSTASFTPTGGLLSGNTYTATITTGAKNVAGIPLANDYVWNFSTNAPLGPLVVDLKSVARFGIIAGVGVSNNAGFSVINNLDVGIYPGARSSVTGFPPAIVVNGSIFAADDIAPPGVAAMLLQAKNDLVAAYNFAAGATTPAPALAPADLGGKTLAPGIWTSASTMLLQNGDLTLDAQGDANAVWIFQIGSSFTSIGSGPFPSSSGGNVILAGGAQAKNVFWQVGASATIGDFTSFKGTVLAFSSITMNSGAKAVGRMLARNGSVVMTDTNIIDKP